MRFVKEHSTPAEVVCSCLKTQMKLSHETDQPVEKALDKLIFTEETLLQQL